MKSIGVIGNGKIGKSVASLLRSENLIENLLRLNPVIIVFLYLSFSPPKFAS